MIDIGQIRQNPNVVKKSIRSRGGTENIVDEISALDELWRKTTQKLELLKAESNRLSKTKDLAKDNNAKLVNLKKDILEARDKSLQVEQSLNAKMLAVPNITLDDVPDGDAKNNQILSTVGDRPPQSAAHEDALAKQGLLDMETAARFTGSRFRYLIGEAATASRKLMSLAIEFAQDNGFTFVLPPVVAKEDLLEATGFFPAGKDDTFTLGDNQFLVGTSEPLLLALASNKKIPAKDLPIRYVGFSTCFRKEAGSYGQDTKGVFRIHQFDKVEMVSIAAPDKSEKELEFLVSMQEKFISKFSLPYQKVLLAAGDQSQIAAKQIDIECWFPSQQRYRETHSASNCTDFQSRLLKTKVDFGDKTELVHTLNATLATERLLLAIVENNLGEQAKVSWPKELTS
ncbi:MAG: serine--tRNA ligase [Patescibacteria group bacterium]